MYPVGKYLKRKGGIACPKVEATTETSRSYSLNTVATYLGCLSFGTDFDFVLSGAPLFCRTPDSGIEDRIIRQIEELVIHGKFI